ncbi:hypothetical protein B0H10DRAFT_2012543, partial [Mycena sp. CBHHK59/15]
MALSDGYQLHVSGGTFTNVAGHLNQYQIQGDLVQSTGENGINILRGHISGDAFHNSEERYPPPKCHPDTRIAVQNLLLSWADDVPSSMWLYGPAGAGKSAIAQTMAETWHEQGKLAAAFFFARWRAQGGSAQRLFPTIAYQLALNIPGLRVPIGLAVESDPAISERSIEDQAQALILRPIAQLRTDRRYMVVIDALDECNSKPTQCRIIQIILGQLTMNDIPLKFLICSRPEPHLREAFESQASASQIKSISLDERFNPGQDILHYLRERFEEIRTRCFPFLSMPHIWPSEQDLAKLVEKASGQFIYASTVLKFVDDEYSHPVERLRLVMRISSNSTNVSIFADLDALYTCILSANPNTLLVVRILGAYFVLPNLDDAQTHCVSFLDGILWLLPGSVRRAFRGLHSLLFIPDSDHHRIRLHHKSLNDFLLDPKRSGDFFLSESKHHADLAKQCFSIVEDSIENPYGYLPIMIAYSHHRWMNHYTFSSDHTYAIRNCLHSFRQALFPAKLVELCGDSRAMTLRFLRMIDFMTTLSGFEAIDLDETWDLLLSTIFDPQPDVLRVFQAWGTEFHGTNSQVLNIHSSLGVIIQMLWGAKCSRHNTQIFLAQNPTTSILYRAAEFALQLLSCRTAELKSHIAYSYCLAEISSLSKFYLPATDYFWSGRGITRWSFTNQWCQHLIDTSPSVELLHLLHRLVSNSFMAPPEEINRPGLIRWLKQFPENTTSLIKVFEKDDGRRVGSWCLISYPASSLYAAVS